MEPGAPRSISGILKFFHRYGLESGLQRPKSINRANAALISIFVVVGGAGGGRIF